MGKATREARERWRMRERLEGGDSDFVEGNGAPSLSCLTDGGECLSEACSGGVHVVIFYYYYCYYYYYYYYLPVAVSFSPSLASGGVFFSRSS